MSSETGDMTHAYGNAAMAEKLAEASSESDISKRDPISILAAVAKDSAQASSEGDKSGQAQSGKQNDRRKGASLNDVDELFGNLQDSVDVIQMLTETLINGGHSEAADAISNFSQTLGRVSAQLDRAALLFATANDLHQTGQHITNMTDALKAGDSPAAIVEALMAVQNLAPVLARVPLGIQAQVLFGTLSTHAGVAAQIVEGATNTLESKTDYLDEIQESVDRVDQNGDAIQQNAQASRDERRENTTLGERVRHRYDRRQERRHHRRLDAVDARNGRFSNERGEPL